MHLNDSSIVDNEYCFSFSGKVELQAAGFTSYVQQGYFELNTLVTEFSGRDKIILLGDFNVGAALPPDIVADQPGKFIATVRSQK